MCLKISAFVFWNQLYVIGGDTSVEINHAVAVARCIGAASGLITGDHWIDANLDTIAFKIYDILKSEYILYMCM